MLSVKMMLIGQVFYDNEGEWKLTVQGRLEMVSRWIPAQV